MSRINDLKIYLLSGSGAVLDSTRSDARSLVLIHLRRVCTR